MSNEVLIIFTLCLIIFASPLISKILRFPVVPIEIALGSTALTYGFLMHNEIFTLVAELGFLYLMFLAGLEVDLKKIAKIDNKTLKLSLIYVGLLYFISTSVVIYFDLSKVFIIALPLISIGIIATLKKEYNKQDWIAIAITVGLIGEIVSIIVLTVTSAYLKFGIGFELYKALGYLGIVFIVIIAIYKLVTHTLWWYPEIKNILMPKDDHLEQDIRISMTIFFLMIATMLYIHLEVALGAFIAGTFVASFFHHNKELPTKLEHFGFGWLVPIFFVWVGSSFNLQSLFLDDLIITAILISFGMIFIRLIASTVFMYDYGIKTSLFLALSHSMPLTLLIAVATLAYQNKSISEFYYLAFILASIIQVIVAMLLIKIVNRY